MKDKLMKPLLSFKVEEIKLELTPDEEEEEENWRRNLGRYEDIIYKKID
jgi:hypothetical protein